MGKWGKMFPEVPHVFSDHKKKKNPNSKTPYGVPLSARANTSVFINRDFNLKGTKLRETHRDKCTTFLCIHKFTAVKSNRILKWPNSKCWGEGGYVIADVCHADWWKYDQNLPVSLILDQYIVNTLLLQGSLVYTIPTLNQLPGVQLWLIWW